MPQLKCSRRAIAGNEKGPPRAGGLSVLPSNPISQHRDSLQDLRARISDRHLVGDLAQHGDLSRGIPDVLIARAQSARRHPEYFAKRCRPTERLPLEQLTGVRQVSGSLIEIASM
jgi:hypothetical protein